MLRPASSLFRRLAACLFLIAPLALAQPSRGSCETPQRLRFALAPEGNLERDLQAFKPLLQDLQEALGIPVETLRPASYSAVVEGLLNGSIHLARLGPASYVHARRASGEIEPFVSFAAPASAWQAEGSSYRSLLIVRADGQRRRLPQLRGASLAMADPHSTSGSVVPRALFSQSVKMPLAEYFGWTGYAGSHEAAIKSVLAGRADAAFVAGIQLAAMQRRGELDPKQIKVLWQSPPLPLDPFVYRSSLCARMRERIAETFLRFHQRHPQALAEMQMTRFIEVRDADFDVVRKIESPSASNPAKR